MSPSTKLERALWVALAVPTAVELTRLFKASTRTPDVSPERVPGMSTERRERFRELRRTRAVRDELQRCQDLGFELVHWGDPRYPEGLLELLSPPSVLYLRGHGPWPPAPSVTVVGARRSTWNA